MRVSNYFFYCLAIAASLMLAQSSWAQEGCASGDCGGEVVSGCGEGCVGGADCSGGCRTRGLPTRQGRCGGKCGGECCGDINCCADPGWGPSAAGCRHEDGSIQPNCPGNRRYPGAAQTLANARQDHFHPNPLWAYGRPGVDATRIHSWNYKQAGQRSWHGNYYHRQWGEPLALVVPPTAAFQTQYSWGVGQTKSLPIYHQYGRPYPGPGASGSGGGGLSATPYWPSNTDQFGVYPVRGPW